MTIVFDLDNTLVDALGSTVRPGIAELLGRLHREGHSLILWTNSRKERAQEILRLHNLRRLFQACIYREDYDPAERDVPNAALPAGRAKRRVRGKRGTNGTDRHAAMPVDPRPSCSLAPDGPVVEQAGKNALKLAIVFLSC
jgi:phosphoglycolate phosphatase-like HAD superfamily hydrolase